MTEPEYTPFELMAVAGARELKDGEIVAVGLGLPVVASFLAKRTHAPNLTLLFELGVVDAEPVHTAVGLADPRIWYRAKVLSGFVEDLVALVTIGGIPPVAVIGLICLMYIVLGCAMDPMSMLVCTMPFIYPLVVAMGYDGIWFGIIYTKVSEIGCVTPPVGMNLYVVAAAAGEDVSVIDVAKGIIPFILADLIVLILLIAFPGINIDYICI